MPRSTPPPPRTLICQWVLFLARRRRGRWRDVDFDWINDIKGHTGPNSPVHMAALLDGMASPLLGMILMPKLEVPLFLLGIGTAPRLK